jgi:hypothetical protein
MFVAVVTHVADMHLKQHPSNRRLAQEGCQGKHDLRLSIEPCGGKSLPGGALTNEEIERALTLLPSATVARMETVGHPLHTQEKEPVLLALTAFLKTL